MEGPVYNDIMPEAIEEIYQETGMLHDNRINICEYADDILRLELYNPWGRNIEFVFSGNVAFFVNWRYLEERGDVSWWKGTILKDNDSFYLIDQIYATVEDTKDTLCWFRGRELKYRWIPKE